MYLCAVLVPLMLLWYPRPLMQAGGGVLPALAIAVAALLAGPVACLAYKPKGRADRRRLLAVILTLQWLAFAGCTLAIYVQRPVYLVFTVDRFDLVRARDLDPKDLARAAATGFGRRPLDGPRYVATRTPADPAEAQRILSQSIDGGKDLQMYPQHYIPYAQAVPAVLKRAQPLALLLSRDTGVLARYLESSGIRAEALRFLPLRAPGRDGAVLLDARDGQPLKVLLIDPW